MGCLKGESEVKKKEAKFACAKCGAKAKKKDHVCKPMKLEDAKKPKAKNLNRKK